MKTAKRDIRLDILRFIAIVLVLGRHTYSIMYPYINIPAEKRSLSESFFVGWQHIGWIGVDLFFVISGFLISDLIFKSTVKGEFSFRNFFIRREFKIYPPFLFFIFITVIFFVLRHHPFTFLDVLKELFFVQNYFHGIWNHTWSLAVEEHFYVLLPLLIIYLTKKNTLKTLPVILLCLMIIALATRIIHAALYVGNYDTTDFFLPTHLRFDSFIPGVYIAYLKNFDQNKYLKLLKLNRSYCFFIFLAAIIFLWFTGELNFYMVTFGFTILSLSFASLLLFFLTTDQERTEKRRLFRWMAIVGKDSYSIYLWHMCVMYWGVSAVIKISHVHLPFYIIIPLYMIVSVVLGIIMSLLIEQPVLRFRNKYFPSYLKNEQQKSLRNA